MKITALKQQVKNPERVSLFVDDKYSFSLSLDEVVKYKVKNGDELSAADVKKFKKISEDGKLKARALAWVLNRPHSTREFRDYMRRKKADEELTENIAGEFTAKKYLNDEYYAKWLYEMRARAGKSNRAIKSELASKGVSREVVTLLFEGQADDEAERLREVIAKKSKFSRYQKNPAKFMQYLTSQGFSYSLVKQELKINQVED